MTRELLGNCSNCRSIYSQEINQLVVNLQIGQAHAHQDQLKIFLNLSPLNDFHIYLRLPVTF